MIPANARKKKNNPKIKKYGKPVIKTNIIDIKKSLIWIESFDFRYMLDIIKSAVGPDCLGLVWRASDKMLSKIALP